MAPWLSERFKRDPADGDRRNGCADLRAQSAAGPGEACDSSGAAAAGRERSSDCNDLAQLAAYLDGRLSGPEREAFLQSLSTGPGRRADLISAAAFIADLDTRSEKVPAELLTRARSAFGARANQRWDLRILFDRRPAAGFAFAAAVLLIGLPVGLLLLDGRMNWPFGLETPSQSVNGPPSSFDALAPAPATPKPALRLDLKAGTNVRRSSDSARSEQDPCETGISGTTDDADRAAMLADRTARSALPPPCGRPSSKSLDMGERVIRSPPAASAPAIPVPAPSSVLPIR